MQKIGDLSFRELYKKMVYIADQNSLNILKMGYQIPVNGDETGILAYGYVDIEHGICFNIFSIVKEEDGKIVSFNDKPMEEKINHRVRLEDVKNLDGFEVKYEDIDLERYVDRAIELNEKFFESEQREAIRYNTQIDGFRHEIFPDDVECHIYDMKEKKLEGMWARTLSMTPQGIQAKVITPVSRHFGISLEDEIELKLYNINDTLRLMYIIE